MSADIIDFIVAIRKLRVFFFIGELFSLSIEFYCMTVVSQIVKNSYKIYLQNIAEICSESDLR